MWTPSESRSFLKIGSSGPVSRLRAMIWLLCGMKIKSTFSYWTDMWLRGPHCPSSCESVSSTSGGTLPMNFLSYSSGVKLATWVRILDSTSRWFRSSTATYRTLWSRANRSSMRRAKGLLKLLPSLFSWYLKECLDVLYSSKRHICGAGIFFVSKSWNGSSRYLKRFWARYPIFRAERADWPFSIVAVWGPSKCAKPSAWDPPPGSLIRAYSGRSLVSHRSKEQFSVARSNHFGDFLEMGLA